MDAPLQGDTGGYTGTAPTHSHDIFPHKQNNHLRAIHSNETNHSTRNPPKQHQPSAHNLPNDINHPYVIHPNETVGAVPVCPPERPRSGVSIPKIHALCIGFNDGCALMGRRGRAHRHRPYPSPSYFSAQSHTTKITICTQSTQTASTVPTKLHHNFPRNPTQIK